jgi:hypothetical protein
VWVDVGEPATVRHRMLCSTQHSHRPNRSVR